MRLKHERILGATRHRSSLDDTFDFGVCHIRSKTRPTDVGFEGATLVTNINNKQIVLRFNKKKKKSMFFFFFLYIHNIYICMEIGA